MFLEPDIRVWMFSQDVVVSGRGRPVRPFYGARGQRSEVRVGRSRLFLWPVDMFPVVFKKRVHIVEQFPFSDGRGSPHAEE